MNKVDLACVIDDDQIYTFAVRRMIDRSEIAHHTLYFDNGRKALDYYQQNWQYKDRLPDLILLDLNMPVLDGWQFLEEYGKLMPEMNKKASLYIVSSSIDEDDHHRAKQHSSVNDFIIKPFDAQQLRQIVEDCTRMQ